MIQLDNDELWFTFPVVDISNYHTIIPLDQCRDLTSIGIKLWRRLYPSITYLSEDIELMFTNAITFNGPHSIVGKLAQEWKTRWDQKKASSLSIEAKLNIPKNWIEMHWGQQSLAVIDTIHTSMVSQANTVNIKPVYLSLDEAIREGWEYMTKLDKSKIFAYPVKAVNYHSVIPIENARDLNTIAAKRRRRIYNSLEDFSNDILLMLDNCATFNGPDSEYGQIADWFSTCWQNKKEDLVKLMLKGPDAGLVNVSNQNDRDTSNLLSKSLSTSTRIGGGISTKRSRPSTFSVPSMKKVRSIEYGGGGSRRNVRTLHSGPQESIKDISGRNEILSISKADIKLMTCLILLRNEHFQKLLSNFISERVQYLLQNGLLPVDDIPIQQALQLTQLPYLHERIVPPPPLMSIRRLLPVIILDFVHGKLKKSQMNMNGLIKERLTDMSMTTDDGISNMEVLMMIKIGGAVVEHLCCNSDTDGKSRPGVAMMGSGPMTASPSATSISASKSGAARTLSSILK